jgi:itaconyl-CoA hydratase
MTPLTGSGRQTPPNVNPAAPSNGALTLYAESTVLSKRDSKSRPTQGIVTVSTLGLNQDGIEVMSFERTMLIYKRGHPRAPRAVWPAY